MSSLKQCIVHRLTFYYLVKHDYLAPIIPVSPSIAFLKYDANPSFTHLRAINWTPIYVPSILDLIISKPEPTDLSSASKFFELIFATYPELEPS